MIKIPTLTPQKIQINATCTCEQEDTNFGKSNFSRSHI